MIVPVINNVRIEAGIAGLESRKIIISKGDCDEGDSPSQSQNKQKANIARTACPIHSTDTLTSSLPDIQGINKCFIILKSHSF